MRRLGNGAADANNTETLRKSLLEKVLGALKGETMEHSAIPGLKLHRRSETSACNTVTYRPELIVFLQGEKRIQVGATKLTAGEGSFLLTSVDLPVQSQITKASPERPLVTFVLEIDMGVVREILSRDEFQGAAAGRGPAGMALGKQSAELLGACARLVDLLHSPSDAAFLGALIQREIIFRVMRSPQGAHLRAIATVGERSNRAARAVNWLRDNYAKPLRIEELADVAQMGVSTLHHHFRAVTAMSPLQYQKQLRLQQARTRMMQDGIDAASAAFEVGYESASQFSREYSRHFGQPPMRNVKTLMHSGAQAHLESAA